MFKLIYKTYKNFRNLVITDLGWYGNVVPTDGEALTNI